MDCAVRRGIVVIGGYASPISQLCELPSAITLIFHMTERQRNDFNDLIYWY